MHGSDLRQAPYLSAQGMRYARVVDADYAVETASLVRSQILQQAATAIVAQANTLPRNVLALLRN